MQQQKANERETATSAGKKQVETEQIGYPPAQTVWIFNGNGGYVSWF